MTSQRRVYGFAGSRQSYFTCNQNLHHVMDKILPLSTMRKIFDVAAIRSVSISMMSASSP